MRASRATFMRAMVGALLLAGCAGGSGSSPSATSTIVPGANPPGATPTAAQSFPTGPGGMPVGTWSLTLENGPAAGTYGGSDEMVCTGLANGPMSVSFQPVGSPPIGQVDATSGPAGHLILISAGGLESGATYGASSDPPEGTITVPEASITDGVLTMRVNATQQFPGEPALRSMALTVTCPLFPADTEG